MIALLTKKKSSKHNMPERQWEVAFAHATNNILYILFANAKVQ